MSESRVRLVVNADDFGIGIEVSRGILRAHADGVVTSTSLLGNCRNLPEQKALLDGAPRLGVGLHLALIGDQPVSPPGSVPTLLTAGGRFPTDWREVLHRWMKGDLAASEVEHEFDAQVARASDAGIRLDHLDTHRNLGFLPAVGRAIETVARRHGIPGIRTTGEPPSLSWFTDPVRGIEAAALAGLSWLTRRGMGALRHGPRSWGYAESGQLDGIRILEILGRLGPGNHEIICHPSETDDVEPRDRRRPYHGAGELGALCSATVKTAIARRGIELVRWSELF